MRVHVVDPSAFTPPYDHALCCALAARGLDVVLETSRFPFAEVSTPDGYERREHFYPWQPGTTGSRLRVAAKLAQHVAGMAGVARRARHEHADVMHFQWLAVQHADHLLLPRRQPVVLTAHDVLPREPRAGQLAAQKRLYRRVDAIVAHSEHGRDRLVHECDVPDERITVIPHGAFTHLRDLAEGPGGPPPLPAEFAGADPAAPVVLFFGLLREYKGLDVLLHAWTIARRAATGGSGTGPLPELWIAGMPRMPTADLQATADRAGNVRWAQRFIVDTEAAALLDRADVVVLPYREIDQSGVLSGALGMGKPMVLSAVGGFPEVAAQGAAALVPPGDATALATTLVRVLGDQGERDRLGAAARAAAAGPYAWSAVAQQHETLYRRLLG